LLIVIVGLGAYAAGRATIAPAEIADDLSRSALSVEVTSVSVGRELTLNVSQRQPTGPLSVNSLAGIVTSVSSRQRTTPGQVVYAVDGIPVRAIEGQLPFYRALTLNDQGPDVRQLKDAMLELGYASTPGPTFDSTTQEAVRAWQSDLGTEPTGTVRLGELVAVPQLPASIEMDTSIAFVGAHLSGGETLLFGTRGDPQFDLIVSAEQARLIPETARVTIPLKARTFPAVIADSSTAANGQVRFRLSAPNGAPVCGNKCHTINETRSSILAQVLIVPKITGPGVPVAAISTSADGTTAVEIVLGDTIQRREVEVLASQDGVAVVRGVEVGDTVRVFSEEASQDSAPSPTAAATLTLSIDDRG